MIKKLYEMLPSREKGETFIIALLMFIGMLFETLGVGLVVPVVSLLIDQNSLNNYPFIQNFILQFTFVGEENFVLVILLLLVFVFLIKNIYLFLINFYKLSFSYRVNLFLSMKIFNTYLNQSYSYFLDKNSSQLIRNINYEVSQTITVINMIMLITTELLVTTGIIVLILYLQPVTAGISIIILILIGFLIFYFTKNIISEFGRKRVVYDGSRLKHLQQSFNSIKDLKIFGKEDVFEKYYKKDNSGSLKIMLYQNMLKSIPQYLIEFTAVLLISAILIVLIYSSNAKPEEFVPILALFAAAAFRMMPSANRILTSFQQIRFAMPSVEMIHNEITNLSNTIEDKTKIKKPVTFIKEVVLEGIHYRYTSKKDWILKDVNLTIPVGAFYGFLGATGSGKSTLIDIITGLLRPTKGLVRADERNIEENLYSWQSKIGYVSQSINLIDDNLKKNIAFGINDDAIDLDKIHYAIRMSGLEKFVTNLPNGIESEVGERGARISGGEKQRLAIARAIYINPSIIIFDEATSSLDNNTEKEIIDAIENLKGKITILMIAHRLSTLKNCDKCFKIENGDLKEENIFNYE